MRISRFLRLADSSLQIDPSLVFKNVSLSAVSFHGKPLKNYYFLMNFFKKFDQLIVMRPFAKYNACVIRFIPYSRLYSSHILKQAIVGC